MPTTPTPEDLPITAGVTGSTPSDVDEIYEKVHKLFGDLLNEANYILKAGTTQNKIQLMRSVIPALMKELTAREEAKSKTQQYEALEQLFQTARKQIKGREVIEDGPDPLRNLTDDSGQGRELAPPDSELGAD